MDRKVDVADGDAVFNFVVKNGLEGADDLGMMSGLHVVEVWVGRGTHHYAANVEEDCFGRCHGEMR